MVLVYLCVIIRAEEEFKMIRFKGFLFAFFLLFLAGCGVEESGQEGGHIGSWAYQLQGADPYEIGRSGFKLIVTDYSRDGTEGERYSRDEIGALRDKGVIPIAYISVGEAEDYRFYWQEEWLSQPPDWLGHQNPEWEGNYEVRYWNSEWKGILFDYLRRIEEEGFEGVYLDKIDAFEYWSDPENGEGFCLSREEAAVRMISLVLELRDYLEGLHGDSDFYFMPQNGEEILDFDSAGMYLENISGIGVEDLFYDGTEPQPEDEVSFRTNYLGRFRDAGKLVLSVDYVDDGSGVVGENLLRIKNYRDRALALGFLPYAARSDRALDELNVIDGIQP